MRAWTVPAGLAVLAVAVATGTTAHAHSAGQPAPGCIGCHSGGDYGIAVSADPPSWSPGDQVRLTVTLTPGFGQSAGIFVAADEGTLGTVGGQGLATVAAGLTHTSPKPISGGQASFTFAWTAPGNPGAVRFGVSTLVANGNGSSSGDAADHAYFDFVYGCQAATYYKDFDGDGFGDDTQPLIHCDTAVPHGYATGGGDCNDSRDTTYPGAVEVCNQQDDDCDGEIDDDAIPVPLYLDGDGDGYYGSQEHAAGVQMMGCVPASGYAAEPNDCKPEDPMINPGMTEVCNLIDDNCDGRIDEYVRPRCGEGWCEREASTCDPSTCFAGEPRDELCNLLDDNCDGVVDEGTLCPAGQACVAAVCVDAPLDPAIPTPPADPDSSDCAVGGTSSPWLAAGLLVAVMALVRRRSGRPA